MKRFVDDWCDFLNLIGTAVLFIPGMCIGFLIECIRPGIDAGREIYHDCRK